MLRGRLNDDGSRGFSAEKIDKSAVVCSDHLGLMYLCPGSDAIGS